VVYSYPGPAPQNDDKDCKIVFVPKPNEAYILCYKCSEGGGHELFLQNCTMTLYIMDQSISKNKSKWARVYRRLNELGVIGQQPHTTENRNAKTFYHQLLDNVCETLAQTALDPFFRACNT